MRYGSVVLSKKKKVHISVIIPAHNEETYRVSLGDKSGVNKLLDQMFYDYNG